MLIPGMIQTLADVPAEFFDLEVLLPLLAADPINSEAYDSILDEVEATVARYTAANQSQYPTLESLKNYKLEVVNQPEYRSSAHIESLKTKMQKMTFSPAVETALNEFFINHGDFEPDELDAMEAILPSDQYGSVDYQGAFLPTLTKIVQARNKYAPPPNAEPTNQPNPFLNTPVPPENAAVPSASYGYEDGTAKEGLLVTERFKARTAKMFQGPIDFAEATYTKQLGQEAMIDQKLEVLQKSFEQIDFNSLADFLATTAGESINVAGFIRELSRETWRCVVKLSGNDRFDVNYIAEEKQRWVRSAMWDVLHSAGAKPSTSDAEFYEMIDRNPGLNSIANFLYNFVGLYSAPHLDTGKVEYYSYTNTLLQDLHKRSKRESYITEIGLSLNTVLPEKLKVATEQSRLKKEQKLAELSPGYKQSSSIPYAERTLLSQQSMEAAEAQIPRDSILQLNFTNAENSLKTINWDSLAETLIDSEGSVAGFMADLMSMRNEIFNDLYGTGKEASTEYVQNLALWIPIYIGNNCQSIKALEGLEMDDDNNRYMIGDRNIKDIIAENPGLSSLANFLWNYSLALSNLDTKTMKRQKLNGPDLRGVIAAMDNILKPTTLQQKVVSAVQKVAQERKEAKKREEESAKQEEEQAQQLKREADQQREAQTALETSLLNEEFVTTVGLRLRELETVHKNTTFQSMEVVIMKLLGGNLNAKGIETVIKLLSTKRDTAGTSELIEWLQSKIQ